MTFCAFLQISGSDIGVLYVASRCWDGTVEHRCMDYEVWRSSGPYVNRAEVGCKCGVRRKDLKMIDREGPYSPLCLDLLTHRLHLREMYFGETRLDSLKMNRFIWRKLSLLNKIAICGQLSSSMLAVFLTVSCCTSSGLDVTMS